MYLTQFLHRAVRQHADGVARLTGALQKLGMTAGYKCPRSVAFMDAMPLSGAGKVLKTKLREPFWHARERQVG